MKLWQLVFTDLGFIYEASQYKDCLNFPYDAINLEKTPLSSNLHIPRLLKEDSINKSLYIRI